MADKRDYYEVLGVSKSASKDEIHSAYRKLAKKYHPDICKEPDAAEKYKEVQEAHDVLMDENKRAAYDRYGHAAFDANGNTAGAGGFGGFGGFQDVDLGDLFGSFFGGGSRRSSRRNNGPVRGNDTAMRIRIDFMDAVNGKDVTIPVTYDQPCTTCGGSGAKSASDIKTCPTCGGSGVMHTRQQTLFGMMDSQTTCSSCNGTGKVIQNKCPTCDGKGYRRVKTDITVHIPAGINEGQQIRVAGKGERGYNGGSNGDLFIEVLIKPHAKFKREGNDIHVEIALSMVDAALGCEVNVDTVYGPVTMKVPEGTQSGEILKLRSKGVKDLRSQVPGDEYVHIKVVTPTNLTESQKEILRSFQGTSSDKNMGNQKKKRGFFR